MKKILFLFFAVLFLMEISNGQAIDAKDLPLRIRDSTGGNGWSPDGEFFVTSTRSENKTKLWNLSTEKIVWETSLSTAQGETLYSQTFIWSNSQKFLLVRDEKERVYLLNAANGKMLWQNNASRKDLKFSRFSPDEKQIVLVSANEKARAKIEFLNIENGETKTVIESDVKFFDSFSFSKGGKLLMFGNFEGKAVFLDAATGKIVKNIALKPCGGLPNAFSRNNEFSPNLTYLVARCGEQTVISNTVTGKILRVLKMKVDFEKTIGFSGDEKILILQDLAGYKVFKFSDNSVKDIDDFSLWFYVDVNYDGSLLMNSTGYDESQFEIAKVETGKIIRSFENHPGVIKALAFNSDGSRFVSGSADRIVRVWDTNTKKTVLILSGHTDEVESVEFSWDGKTLISKSEKEIIVWNAETGAKIRETKEKSSFSSDRSKAISPSGKFALIEEYQKPFRLINARNEETIKEFVYVDQLDNLVFTPDENYFLAKPWWSGWQLWSVESGKPIREFYMGYSYNNRVAFHPDGKIFITGGKNQNILMFNLETGEMLWSLFPVDHEEFKQKKAWEARRVDSIKRAEEYAARADIDNQERAKKVTAKFSHYGTAESFWDQKIAESGAPNKSKLKLPKDKATVAWLALTNDADLPVSIDTNSMTFNPKCKGLCGGAEISSRYVMELENGETRVNGFDMFSSTILPPKTTVYFSVAFEHFGASRAIYLGFTFQKDNPDDENSDAYGTQQKLYLPRESDLPK